MKGQQKYKNSFTTVFSVATVVDNNDPENSYRVKVRIDTIHDNFDDNELPWAARVAPAFMGFGNADIDHAVPEVGTKVLTMFVGNDPNSILYLGGLYKNNNATPSGDQYLGTYGMYTQKGEFIGIDKINYTFKMIYEGKIDISKIAEANISINGPMNVKVAGNIKIESDGNINIKSSGPTKVESDANVEIKSSGSTKIEASGTVDVKATGPATIESTAGVTVKGASQGMVNCFSCLPKCILTNANHVTNTAI